MNVLLRPIRFISTKTGPSLGGLAHVTTRNGLKEATVEYTVGLMSEHSKKTAPPPEIPGFPRGWRDEIKEDLTAQLRAGGTLYGVRSDDAYVARTMVGKRCSASPTGSRPDPGRPLLWSP